MIQKINVNDSIEIFLQAMFTDRSATKIFSADNIKKFSTNLHAFQIYTYKKDIFPFYINDYTQSDQSIVGVIFSHSLRKSDLAADHPLQSTQLDKIASLSAFVLEGGRRQSHLKYIYICNKSILEEASKEKTLHFSYKDDDLAIKSFFHFFLKDESWKEIGRYNSETHCIYSPSV